MAAPGRPAAIAVVPLLLLAVLAALQPACGHGASGRVPGRGGPTAAMLGKRLLALSSALASVDGTCSNGQLDSGESDIDCGGDCPKRCSYGQACSSAADCKSSVCDEKSGSCLCPAGWEPAPDESSCVSSNKAGGSKAPAPQQPGQPSASKNVSPRPAPAAGANARGAKDGADGEQDGGEAAASDDANAEGGDDAEADSGSDGGADGEAEADSGDGGADGEADGDTGSSADTGADGEAETDTGDDADAEADAGTDAEADAGADAEADAGADAEADAEADAGADANADADADAEAEADAAADADADAGADADAAADSESERTCSAAGPKKCKLGEACESSVDCAAGFCGATSRTCMCPVGHMPAANGSVCMAPVQRASGLPLGPTGAATNDSSSGPCTNGVRDGTESDVDCGGTACWRCSLGRACRQANDCDSLACSPVNRTCVCPPGQSAAPGLATCRSATPAADAASAACSNGLLDRGESDVDCGGLFCRGCGFGRSCKANTDCSAGLCDAGKGVCTCTGGKRPSPDGSACLTEAELCFNGAKDAHETDVDCGGSCAAKCSFGQYCRLGADCASGTCNVTTRMCGCPPGAPASADGTRCTTLCDGPANPCRNGGRCVPNASANVTAATNFKCTCPAGFGGPLCELLPSNATAAAAAVTAAAATAVAATTAASPACGSASQPCRNGGKCVPQPGAAASTKGGGFLCQCAAGWAGFTCEVKQSSNGGGGGGGSSSEDVVEEEAEQQQAGEDGGEGAAASGEPPAPAGAAANGGGASRCDSDRPCANGGRCVPDATRPSGFTCKCPAGYSGELCEAPAAGGGGATAAVVASRPGAGASNGTVTATTSSATTCTYGNPCRNGGRCSPRPGTVPDYTCLCARDFAGPLCQTRSNTTLPAGGNPCNPNPCANSGACSAAASPTAAASAATAAGNASAAGGFTCACVDGFAGAACEQDCFANELVPSDDGLTCVGASELLGPGAPSCGKGRPRPCAVGEPCRSAADCADDAECRVHQALGDPQPRCACPVGSFVFLDDAGGEPYCVTREDMCSNGVRDPYEGDVDCGFVCAPKLCGLGKACKGSDGCASGFCSLARGVCECGPGHSLSADKSTCQPQA